MRVSRPTLSRRRFLAGAAASSAALLVGFHVPVASAARASGDTRLAPNAFIRIDRDGLVTLIMPQVEMGQGVYTSIAMILAEELDADWDRIRVEAAPPDQTLYSNPIFGIQVTGNSNSIRAFWMPLRKAAGSARNLLVRAAADRWNVDPDTCTALSGEVLHSASGRKLGYGPLVVDASALTAAKDVPLKRPQDFRLIGKPLHRLDSPEKVNGTAVYGIDVMPTGVAFAMIAACRKS